MKSIRKEFFIVIVSLIIGLPLLWIFGKMNENQSDLIEKEGIETVGVVIEKAFGADNTGRQYHIKFDFRVGDSLVQGYVGLNNNSQYYEKAIIGMKYKVKYLNRNPDKLNNSKIYIDCPVLDEINNIENERKRIIELYGHGGKN